MAVSLSRRLNLSTLSLEKTADCLVGVSQQNGVAPGDGAIAFTYRSHSWDGPGSAIIYDEGRSFRYVLPATTQR